MSRLMTRKKTKNANEREVVSRTCDCGHDVRLCIRFKNVMEEHFEGSPDLVVELVSPDSEERDWQEKYLQNESCGLTEYWVIDAKNHKVENCVLDKQGRYQSTLLKRGKLHSTELDGLWIRSACFWESPLPKVDKLVKQFKLV